MPAVTSQMHDQHSSLGSTHDADEGGGGMFGVLGLSNMPGTMFHEIIHVSISIESTGFMHRQLSYGRTIFMIIYATAQPLSFTWS